MRPGRATVRVPGSFYMKRRATETMMEYWNVIIELDHAYADDGVDEDVLDAFAEWHAAIGRTMGNRLEVTLTIPAENLHQAALTALSLLGHFKGLPSARSMSVLRTADFDRRNGLEPVPPLVSVTEAAMSLGITRQRVLQMIHDGALHGIKVGNSWALVRTEIDTMRVAKHN